MQAKGKSLEQALQIANQGGLKATKSFAQALFSEFTDRYHSLPSLGLGTVEESPHFLDVFDDFPEVGLDPLPTPVCPEGSLSRMGQVAFGAQEFSAGGGRDSGTW